MKRDALVSPHCLFLFCAASPLNAAMGPLPKSCKTAIHKRMAVAKTTNYVISLNTFSSTSSLSHTIILGIINLIM